MVLARLARTDEEGEALFDIPKCKFKFFLVRKSNLKKSNCHVFIR